VGDVEAEAGAFCFVSGGEEGFEHVVFGVIVHAGAGVLDGDGETPVVGNGVDGYLVWCMGCFLCLSGVFDDVFQGNGELFVISLDSSIGDVDIEGDNGRVVEDLLPMDCGF